MPLKVSVNLQDLKVGTKIHTVRLPVYDNGSTPTYKESVRTITRVEHYENGKTGLKLKGTNKFRWFVANEYGNLYSSDPTPMRFDFWVVE